MIGERSRQYGASLMAAAAIGGLSVKAAEAMPSSAHQPETAAQLDRPGGYQYGPPEVRATVHNGQELLQEALKNLTKRWDGVLVLSRPLKPAYVNFNTVDLTHNTAGMEILGDDQNDALTQTYKAKYFEPLVIPKPGLTHIKVLLKNGKVQSRPYVAIYDVYNSKWGFLDIKYATEIGALQSYAFKGKSAKSIPYPVEAQENDMPVLYSPAAYSPDYSTLESPSHNPKDAPVLRSIVLPINTEAHKTYKLVKSSSFPH